MRAVKGNKEYTVDATQKKSYQDMGFDILDDDGNVVDYGRGKTVSYDAYAKLEKENANLKKENAELKAGLPENTGLNSEPQENPNTVKKAGTKKAGD